MIALDASALLALLFEEAGHEQVASAIGDACLSAVNLSEVLGRFARDGHGPALINAQIRTLPIEIVAFGPSEAEAAADLVPWTRALGLSLGDRACLALARSRSIPAMTADRTWAELQIGVPILTIR